MVALFDKKEHQEYRNMKSLSCGFVMMGVAVQRIGLCPMIIRKRYQERRTRLMRIALTGSDIRN